MSNSQDQKRYMDGVWCVGHNSQGMPYLAVHRGNTYPCKTQEDGYAWIRHQERFNPLNPLQ